MNTYNPLFDAADVDTPAAMTPTTALDQISSIPVTGTGLMGQAYAPGTPIWKISILETLIEASDPDATFTATELAYGSNQSDTTIAEFLRDDAASVSGNGDLEMGPSGMIFKGFVFIPEGLHEISVASDDGFKLKIGGVDFSEFNNTRPTEETSRVSEFDGGLYPIELLYFDGGGGMSLNLKIDGLTVDQSAFYQSVDDLTNSPAGVATIPVDEYHPSYTLGEAVIDDPTTETGTNGRDVIEAMGGDDVVLGNDGDDELYGGYGDDQIYGGDGDDVIDGGRGSDISYGGEGNDLIIARSDAGEQRIGQLAIGQPTRGDPDGEVNEERQKLFGYEGQPLVSDDIMFGGGGRDTFLISPLLNGKLEIIEKHTRADGSINWAGVAGENNELHDHWTDAFGIKVIGDYDEDDDKIAVIGHTAQVNNIRYRDVDGDGDEESIITVLSNQHGGGGAHAEDLLGMIIVHGDKVEKDDIQVDAGVTYGIVENIADVAEALFPEGDLKVTELDGETIYGYDTRDDRGNMGPITGSPEDFIDNPFFASAGFADPSQDDLLEPTRYPFEPLEIVSVKGQTKSFGGANDVITSSAEATSNSIPAPIAYWDFGTSVDGATVDALGGPPAKAYTLYENQALLRTDGIVAGPKGELNALSFNGEDEFAYISHDTSVQITQGTIALWFKPEDVDDFSIFLSKDQQGSGDGGHFRLGHTEKGGLFLRMAEGDGGSNHAWKTNKMLTEDKWHHIAVTFTEDGVRVLLDGKLVPASKWSSVEGNVKSPNTYTEAFLLMNQEPWVLGADQANTEFNNSAQEFGIDNENLSREFKGAIADVAVFGGFNSTDALTTAEVKRIAKSKVDIGEIEGPSGQQPMVAADDVFSGGGGKDSIYGGAGDDSLYGGGGSDSIEGGYGDDVIDGGAGNDKLDGGRGSDLLIGGIGNDILYARSDAGEDRAAQMFLDTGNQRDPAYIDLEYSKLHDWIDQPLVADDILVGGAGKDHFLIELQINGTLDAIMDNLLDDGRTIRWHGVAGENQFVHEHWVDSIGVDIIADFNASEDKISVLGHTTNIDIDYKSHDSNGDGQADSIVSIITAYSQQGGGGGAHDEDYLGYIVVHGDLVTEEMVTTDAGVHFGIVETIDDLQEALAPSGETKTRSYEGAELFGYDSRDVEGDPIGSDPEAFSENPFKDLVTFADKTLADLPKLTILMTDAGGTFDGTQYGAIAHDASYQRNNGTISFSFKADSPGGRDQALLSKDHAGHKDGGHFTAWISSNGFLLVRFQDEKNNSRFLKYHDERIIAGQEYHVAFSFTKTTLSLFVNGEMVDADDGFRLGMIGNTEEILVGASARQRIGDDDRAEWLFDGEITNIAFMSRPLDQIETILLSEAGGAVAALSADVAPPPSDNVPSEPAPTGKPIGGTNSNDTIKGTEDGETIKAKSGNDNVSARSGGDDVYGGRGDDKLRGGDGDDDVYGERGNDRVYGDDGDDDVFGDQGNDRVDGGDGDDEVYGGDGSDFVAGGDGDDLVAGGKGIDKLYGGDGEDQFFFAEFGEENVDRIYGFKLSDDVIALDEDVFTAIDGDNIDASLFLGTVAGSETEKLIYDKKRGEVFYDADGSGNAEAELVARVNRNLDLTEDHFVLT